MLTVIPKAEKKEVLMASTTACEITSGVAVGLLDPVGVGQCTRLGIPPNQFGIFRLKYDLDYLKAARGCGHRGASGERVELSLSAAPATRSLTRATRPMWSRTPRVTQLNGAST